MHKTLRRTKVGQVINTSDRDEEEMRSETALADFGLFMTSEKGDVAVRTSRVNSTFAVKR